ncbi:LCP family protein [Halobacillus shinanisalinarum]|uniref:Regulatory protein MsrR n=1 Tax=Halobacillus shinanisalinarum TaxID=2932258 RepID=A0ABY4H1I2_9BACI|nr:LCP family protein [Halobacillus shinanisalinarum]UOQ92827.1 LCP family protein [Halobacillus shinanisalinarum]
MTAKRSVRRRKRRLRKKRLFVAALLLIFIITLGYSGYQYMMGKQESLGKVSGEDGEVQLDEISSKYKDEFKGVDNHDGKTNVLLLGVDQRGSETPRSDTIMIAQYDPENESAKLVSIMRDTFVNIPGHGYNKINAAFAFGGPELLRQTIAENFGIKTEYYSIIDFTGFTHIVNTLAPSGVKVDVEKDMQYKGGKDTNINLQAGTQRLNGDELLGYARYRSDSRGDFARVERQQKVIKLLKDELLSFSGVLKAPRLIGTIQPYVDTNMGNAKILTLGKDFILNPPKDIETLSVPTDDNVQSLRKPYPIGLVLSHDEQETAQTIQEFLK